MVEIKENDVKMSDLVDKLVPNVISELNERGECHKHFIKPGTMGNVTMADNSHCAGWMYGS